MLFQALDCIVEGPLAHYKLAVGGRGEIVVCAGRAEERLGAELIEKIFRRRVARRVKEALEPFAVEKAAPHRCLGKRLHGARLRGHMAGLIALDRCGRKADLLP